MRFRTFSVSSLLVCALFLAGLSSAFADVVVAVRYYKVKGESHSQLFHYSDDGKLVRQLTHSDDAQNIAPMFSPDGKTIVFTQRKGVLRNVMSIPLAGGEAQTLPEAPAWYLTDQVLDGYTERYGNDLPELWQKFGADRVLPVPGSQQEFVTGDDADATDGSFKLLALRQHGAGKQVNFFEAGQDILHNWSIFHGSPFLINGPLRVAFLQWTLNSTDGDAFAAIDLNAGQMVELSHNGGVAIPHGKRVGFFVVCEERYQPLGDGKKTVNCTYLDWWNEKLERTRFASAISIFEGASIFTPGQPILHIPKG